MIRPRLVLATFALLIFGLAAGAEAAELVGGLVRAVGDASGFRGPGLYLNLFKFIPVLVIYLLWAWTTYWVDDDTKELNNLRFEMWNSVVFFSGVLGFVLRLGDAHLRDRRHPAAPGVLHPALDLRLRTKPDGARRPKVLTPYHLGEVANGMLMKLGIRPLFNQDTGDDRAGPPIHVHRQEPGATKEDPVACSQAEESRSYMSAKELVYDAVLRRATDIHLEPTTEQLSVRYRIDGILHAAEPFDRPTGDAVVNVFKVLSAMDISEKRKPQDGSFGAKLKGAIWSSASRPRARRPAKSWS